MTHPHPRPQPLPPDPDWRARFRLWVAGLLHRLHRKPRP